MPSIRAQSARTFVFVVGGLLLCDVAAAAPSQIQLSDADTAARGMLANNENAQALLSLNARQDVPGLLGLALEKNSKYPRACALYAADKKAHPERAEAAQLRLARCLSAQKKKQRALAAWQRVLAGPLLGKTPLVVVEAADALVQAGQGQQVVPLVAGTSASKGEGSFANQSAPPRDNLQREAMAKVLLHVVRYGASASNAAAAQRALIRLYRDLPETVAAQQALSLPQAKALAAHKDRNLAVARARELMVRHDSPGVISTLKRHGPKPSDVSDLGCEIRFLNGKAYRKMRRYRQSRRAMAFVKQRCPGEFQKKAIYIAARVASYQNAKDAQQIFDAFLAAYPQDGLADDVLIWQAENHVHHARYPQAKAAYARLLKEHPDGDMADKARFDAAFLLARLNDARGAIALLDTLLRQQAAKLPVGMSDQALYWRARLKAFPSLDSYSPNSDITLRQEGITALAAFAAARPASFYGQLARLLVIQITGDASSPAEKAQKVRLEEVLNASVVSSRSALKPTHTLPLSAALQNNPRFLSAMRMVRAGYDAEAVLILDTLDPRTLPAADAVTVTALYNQVGAFAKAHQTMRFSGHANLGGRPGASSLYTWALAYPLAHQDALKAAAVEVKLPVSLMLGLAREESAFDATVLSWAGATGLCQLMPPTAKEEAHLLKLPPPNRETLRNPFLNARLGAHHLARRLKMLKHPLLAIGAYNAGPGAVKRWMRNKASGYVTLDAWVEAIPVAQTRGYIKKVTGSWVTYTLLDGGNRKDLSFSLYTDSRYAPRILIPTAKGAKPVKQKARVRKR